MNILITGAGSGIGLACAHKLGALPGARIWAVGRQVAALEAVCAGLPGATALPLDVADEAAVRRAFAELPPLDVLVLNAGLCATAALGTPASAPTWRAVLGTNLDGAYYCLDAAAPSLRPGARVIAISSGLGKLGRAEYGAYCAAKHGVIGLVRAAARELAPRRITVNAVCPGWVDTPMARADVARAAAETGRPEAQVRADAEAGIPLGRFVEAEEVADLIAFLVSPAAAMITGEAYNISGGEFTA